MLLTQILQKIKSAFYTKAETDTKLNTKANDSDVVHKSGDETVDGAKTFTSMLTCSATVALLGTSTDKYLAIQSGNTWDNGARISLYSKEHTNNSGQFEIVAFNNENKANVFRFTADGVIPTSIDGTLNLGTSSNKWKTLNGINPGALSLPKYDQYVTLTFQLNAQIQATFTGFLQVKANVSSGSYLIVTINGLEVVSVSPSAFTGHILVPINENDQIYVTVTNGNYLGNGSLIIFKAQGNV